MSLEYRQDDIMVECGPGKRLFFDFGRGCLRNIGADADVVPTFVRAS
jgi:hypothetical protein